MKQYLFIFTLIILTSCYISRKVETPSSLKIDKNFSVVFDKPLEPKYLLSEDESKFKSLFIEGLKNELINYNVTVIENDVDKSDFVLKITSFRLRETVSTSTVDDPASEYNSQQYSLHSCDAGVDFVLLKEGVETEKGWAGVNKDEKLTNNRNVGDYVLGTNKDGSEYRHKQLSEDIFDDLSQRAGRRTAARITKKLTK